MYVYKKVTNNISNMYAIFHNFICRNEVREDVDAKLVLKKIRRTSRNSQTIAKQHKFN